MSEHVASKNIYLAIYLALIVMTGTTVAAAYVDLGRFNVMLALLIATTKATLVALFFMHLRESLRLTWVVVSAAVVWLVILITAAVADVLTRGWLGTPGS